MSIRTKQSPAGEIERGMDVKMEEEVVRRRKGKKNRERKVKIDRRKTEGQQLAKLIHTYISGLWMQDKTGTTHLGFVSVCVCACVCFHFCVYVLACIFIYIICVSCVRIRGRDNNDVTRKNKQDKKKTETAEIKTEV